MPFSVRPPYTRTDLTTRVFVDLAVAASLLPQSMGRRHATHAADMEEPPQRPPVIVVCAGMPETGALAKVTDREYPDLRTVVSMLRQLDSRDALSAAVLKIVAELPRPVPRQP